MSLRIAIVGGGLGGMAAALFLHRAGMDVKVFEKVPELREAGAGIVVAPNMVRILEKLGLAERLTEYAVQLEAAWEFRRWENGKVLFSQPMGEECVRLYGTHCYVAHRADILSMYENEFPRELLFLDQQCVGVEQKDDEAELRFVNGAGEETTVVADVVIGADGIHSAIREAIVPEVEARFAGLCAYRCLVPADKAPEMALRPVQTLWVGPGRHFVYYPISNGQLVNIVAYAPAEESFTESWTAEADLNQLAAEYQGWDPRIQQLIAAATQAKRLAIYDRTPLDTWTRGRITLMGDAAHAMLPFFAQGAAQATEDAYVIAECLKGIDRVGVPAALQRYESLRRPRANEAQLMSRGREVGNHLPDGPEQQKRDAAFAKGDPLRQSGWLYGYDVDADLAASE